MLFIPAQDLFILSPHHSLGLDPSIPWRVVAKIFKMKNDPKQALNKLVAVKISKKQQQTLKGGDDSIGIEDYIDG